MENGRRISNQNTGASKIYILTHCECSGHCRSQKPLDKIMWQKKHGKMMVKQGNSHTTHATKENRNFWKKGPIKHTYVHKIMSLHSTKEKRKFLGQCLKNECILVSSELFFMMYFHPCSVSEMAMCPSVQVSEIFLCLDSSTMQHYYSCFVQILGFSWSFGFSWF